MFLCEYCEALQEETRDELLSVSRFTIYPPDSLSEDLDKIVPLDLGAQSTIVDALNECLQKKNP